MTGTRTFFKKLEEYRVWGVRHIWLIDPWLKKLYVYSGGSLSEVKKFDLPEMNENILATEIV